MLTFLSLDGASSQHGAPPQTPPRSEDSQRALTPLRGAGPLSLTGQLGREPQAPSQLEEKKPEAPKAELSTFERVRTQAPNAITLAGYALGLWWAVGGPTWAAIVSILADELDGRMARAMNATSELGSNLDWAADVALVPMTLLRLGRATNLGAVPLLAAPPILFGQASLRSDGWRPPLGSPRAVIMVAAILFETLGGLRRVKV